jgi:hypothetical protein
MELGAKRVQLGTIRIRRLGIPIDQSLLLLLDQVRLLPDMDDGVQFDMESFAPPPSDRSGRSFGSKRM